ncbi:MAG: secretin N-terminal domain-containing protein [Thermodesulfobacteriota bacterium]
MRAKGFALALLIGIPVFVLLAYPRRVYLEEAVGLPRTQVEQRGDEVVITFTWPEEIKNYEVIKLESPPRLIVDLWGIKGPAEVKSLPGLSPAFKAVKLKEYKDRARLLLQFASPTVPRYRLAREKNRLVVAFRPPAGATALAAAPAEASRARVMAHQPPQELKLPEIRLSGRRVAQLIPPAAGGVQAHATPGLPFTGEKITLNFKDADVRDVFRLIAEVSRLNIIMGEDVKGKVTVRMIDVPWDQALDTILKLHGLATQKMNGALRIAARSMFHKEAKDRIRKEAEAEAKRLAQLARERAEARREALESKRAARELEELVVENFKLSYLDADDLAKQLGKLKSDRRGASITSSAKTNSVLIRDLRENVDEMAVVIKQLDKPTPQVLIEARLVDVASGFGRDLGIQWSAHAGSRSGTFAIRGGQGVRLNPADLRTGQAIQLPTMPPNLNDELVDGQNLAINLPAFLDSGIEGFAIGSALGLTIGRIGDLLQLDVRLSALETKDKVRILSSPKVVTLDGREAEIRQGQRIPFQVQTESGPSTIFKDADLSLKVTPRITPENTIFLKVEITRDAPGRVFEGGVSIDKNRASTELLLKDGETVVIGGIVTSRRDKGMAAVPALHKIPILGWLFKRTTRSEASRELLVFITARIVALERVVSGG